MDMADSSADDGCPGPGSWSVSLSRGCSFSWDIGGNMVDDILSTSWYLLLVCVANNAGNDDAGDVVVDVAGGCDVLDSMPNTAPLVVVAIVVVVVDGDLGVVVVGGAAYGGVLV